MGINKIIKNINKYFGQKKVGNDGLELIDELLDELKSKIIKLEKKLDKEESKSKRKHFKLEIRIARAELKKAKRRRDDLSKKLRR